ncbi:MAG: hypothetical protein WD049_03810 [Candidatus Paceibacterota bacterium]
MARGLEGTILPGAERAIREAAKSNDVVRVIPHQVNSSGEEGPRISSEIRGNQLNLRITSPWNGQCHEQWVSITTYDPDAVLSRILSHPALDDFELVNRTTDTAAGNVKE